LATALATARKTAEAASVLKAEIDRTPDNAQALVLLGWIEVGEGHTDKARDNFRLAVERQPNNNSGYLALARLDMTEQRLDDAIAILRSGRRAVPDDWMMQFELGVGLQTANRYDDAIAEYENMLSSNPDSLIAANNLAVLLVDHRGDAASLERATALAAMLSGSDLSQFIDTRGWVSYRRGDYEAAAALLQRAAADAPDRAAVRYHLGMAYLALHENGKAAAELQAAAALKPDPELAAEIAKALTASER
jgi:tetratricopeptide (TPR) repeat protein